MLKEGAAIQGEAHSAAGEAALGAREVAASFDSHGGENGSGGSGMTQIWRWHTGKEGVHFDKIRRSDAYGV